MVRLVAKLDNSKKMEERGPAPPHRRGGSDSRGRGQRTRGSGRGLDLLASRRRVGGLGLLAGSPETLLRALLGEPVARADLQPGGSGLAGGFNLGSLQFLGRLSEEAGGV